MTKKAGFSLVEVMVATAMMSMALAAVMVVQFDLKRSANRLEEVIELTTDGAYGERVLFKDLIRAGPSYNLFKTRDNEGRAFFDFYSDVPVSFFQGDRGKRSLTLTLGGTTEFIFAVDEGSRGPLFIYDIVSAYDVGTSEEFNKSAPLKFVSLNRNQWIENLQDSYGDIEGTSKPRWWVDGELLLLDTPAVIRPVKDGAYDMNIAGRSPAYLGVVHTNSGQLLLPSNEIRTHYYWTHPASQEMVVDSVDKFLKEAPSMGGGQPQVRIRPISIVKYSLSPEHKNGGRPIWSPDLGKCIESANLFRSTMKAGNKWGTPQLVSDKVAQLVLTREAVVKKIVDFQIQKLIESSQQDKCK